MPSPVAYSGIERPTAALSTEFAGSTFRSGHSKPP
jgi:hypothetical protein